MASRYGNTSTSALISGIQVAKAKQNAVNDQAAAYEWDSSAQTPEDYQAYTDYLKKQQGATNDPGKKLTYQSKLMSAQGSFASNEIQRSSTAVLYGTEDNTTKYKKMYALYQQAVASGNMNQAQNLEAQLASLDKTIQNEQAAAGRAATADSKKAINLALKHNEVAYDAIMQAARTGQPIKDENGQVIKGKLVPDPKTGAMSVQLDDSAGPIRVTARQAAQAKAISLIQKSDILDQAVESGLDEDGTYSTQKANMQSSEEWAKYTSPQLLDALNKQNGGTNPFTNKIDPTTGTSTPTLRQVKDYAADGTPIYQNGFLSSTNLNADNPIDLSFNRKIGTSPADLMDNYTVQTVKSDEMNRKLKDPVTGKILYAGTSNDGILNPGIPGTIPQTKEDLQAGKAPNYLDPKNFTSPLDYYSHLNPQKLKEDAGALLNGVGGIFKGLANPAQAVSNILGAGVAQRAQAAKAAAALAAARAAQPAINAAVSRGQAQAQAIGPSPTPARLITAMNTAPKATPSNPNPLPVQNRIDQAFAVQAKAPAPAPAPQKQAQWWNPFSWF